MHTLKSLEKTDFNSLFKAFNEAFIDYEIQITAEELRALLKRRGFVPELSFGAFEDDRLVAFTFNGIGFYNDLKTAYDTGTGTIKEFRGRGIATEIFNYSIPFLKEAGISQYLLEVLQHNTKAVSVYRKLGFEVSREFNYFTQVNQEIKIPESLASGDFIFREIGPDSKELFMQFWDYLPSWQNSFEAINRCRENFKITGAFSKNKLVGYCIFEPVSGDITQISVHKDYRRKGIGSILLKNALGDNRNNIIKVINCDITCDSLTEFLAAAGILLKGKQFEMIRKI